MPWAQTARATRAALARERALPLAVDYQIAVLPALENRPSTGSSVEQSPDMNKLQRL
jgi:hypothetical protein